MTEMTQTEREVWRTVQELNQAWTGGRVDALERYFHRDMVAITPMDRERLEGRMACIASWARFVDQATIHDWRELDPLVRIHENAAVVTCYYELDCSLDGERTRLAGRDLLFMVKESGRWQVVADQFSEPPSLDDTAPEETALDEATLKATAQRWLALWQGGDLDAVWVLHAPDFVDHSPAGRRPDREGLRQGIVDLYRAFPDVHGDADDLLVDTSTGKVVIRWSATGTHRAPFLGYPVTNRQIQFQGIEILRIEQGQVVEHWGEWDGLALEAQLSDKDGS